MLWIIYFTSLDQSLEGQGSQILHFPALFKPKTSELQAMSSIVWLYKKLNNSSFVEGILETINNIVL